MCPISPQVSEASVDECTHTEEEEKTLEDEGLKELWGFRLFVLKTQAGVFQ